MKAALKATAVAAAVAGALALSMASTQAAPVYTSGSFAINTFTSTTGNVQSSSAFTLTANLNTGSPTGDFATVFPTNNSMPSLTPMSTSFDFNNLGSLGFSDASLGTFTASNAYQVSNTNNGLTGAQEAASATWYVYGSFMPGSSFATSPSYPLTGSETWTLSQTGGPGAAISMSATFASPAAPAPVTGVPEPATLALLGAGLAGLGAMRRRRNLKA